MINKINVFFFLEIWAFSYLNFVYLFNRHLPPKITDRSLLIRWNYLELLLFDPKSTMVVYTTMQWTVLCFHKVRKSTEVASFFHSTFLLSLIYDLCVFLMSRLVEKPEACREVYFRTYSVLWQNVWQGLNTPIYLGPCQPSIISNIYIWRKN